MQHKSINKEKRLNFPAIMGIVNITPDSFYQGSRYSNNVELLNSVEQMLIDGADIIDIGAMSSRPGAAIVDLETEKNRLLPALKNIKKLFPDAVISVDTFKSEVAHKALDAGASIINDISAAELDPNIVNIVARYNACYIYMHMKGIPETMQNNPQYSNVTNEVYNYLQSKKDFFLSAGINKLIADPGFGFGKTLDNNYELLKNLSTFKKLNIPVLVGISRKSMIYKLLNQTPEQSLNGTSVLHTIALLHGADILRVHDVKEAKEVIKLVEKTTKPLKSNSV